MKRIKIILALTAAVVLMVGSGCQNTQAQLDACNNDLANAEGRLEQAIQNLNQCMTERDMYRRQLEDAQQELQGLRDQGRSREPVETGLEAFGGTLDVEKGTITVDSLHTLGKEIVHTRR